MSNYSGPNISNSGLILNLDASNKKSTKGLRNILDWSTWIAGTVDGATGYSANGDGNTRILDLNPWGNTDVIWDVSNQDITSDADGGWNSTSYPIDNTKLYRFSTWIQRKTIGNGSVYLGCNSNSSVLNRSNSAVNSNPYFSAQGWYGAANTWYLVVGHIWPAGSGTGAVHQDSGVYNLAGFKVITCNDFIWSGSSTTAYHRSYLYYSTDITTNQQWYQPRMESLDGYQPSISELLNNIGNNVATTPQQINGTLIGTTNFSKTTSEYFIFNGSTSYIDCGNPSTINKISGTNTISVGAWVYYTAYGGSSSYSVITCKGTPWVWLLENPSNTFRFRITAGGVDTNIADTTTHILNRWYYVFGTYDGVNMKIYVDGILKNTKAQSGVLGTTNTSIKIGCYTPTTYNLTGRIAQISVYDRTLSATEINSNFNATRSRFNV